MKKIEWENYQDGDSTPLNAENLNLLQDNIEEEFDTKANIIDVYNKTEINGKLDTKAAKLEFLQISASTETQGATSITTFSERDNNTSGKLIAQNTGFKVGPGVSFIEISSQIYYGSLTSAAGNINAEIYKNGSPINRTSRNVSPNAYEEIVFSPLIVSVQEGDIFTVGFSTVGDNSRIYGYDATTGERTWLLAKIID